MAAFFVLYWRWAEGRLESAKAGVMAKQRAVSHSLGPRILPLKERIEGWVKELAGPWPGDFVAPGLDLKQVEREPGVYLRLRLAVAKDQAAIEKAATRSLLDGFTSCLFVRKSHDPREGPGCQSTADCEPGMLCNEWDVCTRPPRPYNMRLLYRAMRVLSDEWTQELYQADSELGVTAYERDLKSVTEQDVPVAIEVLTRAKYFTVVLDEEPPGGLPEELPNAEESEEERLQRVAHPARVGIFELEPGRPVLRLRRPAAGELVRLGAQQTRSGENLAAQKRQANSCALALQVKQAIAEADAKRSELASRPNQQDSKPKE